MMFMRFALFHVSFVFKYLLVRGEVLHYGGVSPRSFQKGGRTWFNCVAHKGRSQATCKLEKVTSGLQRAPRSCSRSFEFRWKGHDMWLLFHRWRWRTGWDENASTYIQCRPFGLIDVVGHRC
ncbi:hypothetical protein B0H65DRAFT_473117 [Neurospora tetraspora]|uniref:Secreted protein n=1 Tax=Neurospora tetraspora TaxID=94610 RepID=A0AAE0MQB4_9PEZI|nr:hypothetical protein B0H65DRAFT_473117 [Neurospora tetraspora]